MKNWIENIEDYIDGNLNAGDKLAMEKAMASDENLRTEVALAKLMQEAIEKTGEIELRNYLKANTVPHKASKVWLKYIAGAASIAAMLICAIFIYKAYAPHNGDSKESNFYGFNDTTESDDNTLDLDKNNPIASVEEDDKELNAIDTQNYNPSASVSNDNNEQFNEMDQNTNGKFLLAQTTMVPIVIAADISKEKDIVSAEETSSGKGAYDYKSNSKKSKSPAAANDSTLQKVKTAAAPKILPSYNWNVSFYENSNIDVNISNKIVDKTTVNLEVENLDPNNSLILQYKNSFYLKSGNEFYLLNPNQPGVQNQKITDPTLLKALNRTSY